MTSRRSQPTRDRSRVRPARWLIALLCLATWRGPIPCLHAHAGEAVPTTHLGHHLDAYHPDERTSGILNWHFHLLLPWQNFECFDCADDPEPPLDPLTQEGALVVSSACHGILSALSPAQAGGIPLEYPETAGSGSATQAPERLAAVGFSSFMGSLLLSVPLRAVTGVALC